ncbi:hypothetical protein BTVI_41833 [Pitangus sulphuratus]|nr:hypothetical protein BTVI_41833 [Pitangus sulphuratus]
MIQFGENCVCGVLKPSAALESNKKLELECLRDTAECRTLRAAVNASSTLPGALRDKQRHAKPQRGLSEQTYITWERQTTLERQQKSKQVPYGFSSEVDDVSCATDSNSKSGIQLESQHPRPELPQAMLLPENGSPEPFLLLVGGSKITEIWLPAARQRSWCGPRNTGAPSSSSDFPEKKKRHEKE